MKPAVYDLGVPSGWELADTVGAWRCHHDNELLAVDLNGPFVWLAWADLVPLAPRADGLRVYGLTDRTHRTSKSRRGGSPARSSRELVDGPPFYIYCPRPACGRCQIVRRPLA